ncbi:MAG: hypothetical protein AAB867_01405 [Patescibacteria group bacterium]
MFQFILTDILMFALGVMLYLAARSLPRISEDGAPVEAKRTVFERFVMSDIPHRVDAIMNTQSGKLLRRLKVLMLRFDNYLTERLKKIHTKGAEREKKIDLAEITAESTETPAETAAGDLPEGVNRQGE